jgi:probable F420-dependent oxidoreductase
MEFGLQIHNRGALATPEALGRLVERADALGFSSIHVSDHIVMPVSAARSVYPYDLSGEFPGGSKQAYLEPIITLAYVAHVTRRMRLGTSVLLIPNRNPMLTAKMLASLDVLSNGRAILGAGVGWLREEFEALAAPPFEHRGAVTDEYLDLMRSAWTTDPVTYEGKHYTVRDVHVLPKPVQPGGIPLWIGGHSDAALRRTVRIGEAWHPIGLRPPVELKPPEYAAHVARLHALARAAGRDPASIKLTFWVPMEIRSNLAKDPGGDRLMFRGTAKEVIADIKQYQDVGVSYIVLHQSKVDVDANIANIERFCEDVRPHVS